MIYTYLCYVSPAFHSPLFYDVPYPITMFHRERINQSSHQITIVSVDYQALRKHEKIVSHRNDLRLSRHRSGFVFINSL